MNYEQTLQLAVDTAKRNTTNLQLLADAFKSAADKMNGSRVTVVSMRNKKHAAINIAEREARTAE